jgi:hypothetical protein
MAPTVEKDSSATVHSTNCLENGIIGKLLLPVPRLGNFTDNRRGHFTGEGRHLSEKPAAFRPEQHVREVY